ncbi:MAG: hypothetical protein OXF41_16200 [bacterium]|nr:hypothetical protein [bacterium]
MIDSRFDQLKEVLALDRLLSVDEVPLQEGFQQKPEQSTSCPTRGWGDSSSFFVKLDFFRLKPLRGRDPNTGVGEHHLGRPGESRLFGLSDPSCEALTTWRQAA